MKLKHLAFVCLLAAMPQAVWAAELARLDDMVVTASRHASPLSEVPASITVISRADIEASAATRVDEVLKSVPGVDVVRDDGVVGGSMVFMRGTAEQGRTLILLDGQALNKSEMGQVNWNLVNLADVERIEVVRGPNSALYGSNAMGGVINIITRKPGEDTFEGEVRTSYGTFNTGSAGTTAGGTSGDFGYQLAYDYIESDGYDPVIPEERDGTTIKKYIKEHQARTRFTYSIDDADFALGYQHIDGEEGEGTKIKTRDGYYVDRDTDRADLSCNVEFDQASLAMNAFYSHEDYNRFNDESIRKGKYTNKDVESLRTDGGLGILATVPVNAHLLAFGLDARHGAVDGKDLYKYDATDPDNLVSSNRILTNEGQQEIYALFFNGEFLLGDEVILHAGGRYDYARAHDGAFSDTNGQYPTQKFDDETWNAFSPRLALRWNITDDTALRFATGKAFRAPILDDMFRNGKTKGGTKIGNPDLDPEHLINAEVGLDQRLGDRSTVGMTAYYSQIKDFFESIYIDPDEDFKQVKNVSEVEIYGVELETSSRWTDWFSTWANATWNYSEIKKFDENTAIEGNHLIDSPPLKWNVGLSFDVPTIGQIDWIYRYVGRRYGDDENSPEEKLDDYLVVDVNYTKRFSDRAEITFAINDLFDEEYLTRRNAKKYDTKSPGRYASVGCTVRF